MWPVTHVTCELELCSLDPNSLMDIILGATGKEDCEHKSREEEED